ncbi:MAG TPA: hypothetical protein VHW09_10915 [Bryobacteraceae bacterium]|jgi:hypothetical protein|nr:hypothetical protein [Bryobacteraceae bacterium]
MKKQFSMLATAAGAILLAIPLCAANHTAGRNVWPAETLSGKITIVEPATHTVVIQTAGGVPFDMVITGNTRIEKGNQTLTMQDLKQDMNQNVSVRFVPESRGDVARSIQLNG